MDESKIIWLIEDDPEQAEQYARLLESASAEKFQIEVVSPRPKVEDYGDLLMDGRTGAVILDQRLSEQSGVAYEGIQVAEWLRTIRPELPIFILTQHESDDLLRRNESLVEAIIDKADLGKSGQRLTVHVVRILRQIGHYQAALTQKQQRLAALIDRKLTSGLSEEENIELENLRADWERPLESQMTAQEHTWKTQSENEDALLRQLKELTNAVRGYSQK